MVVLAVVLVVASANAALFVAVACALAPFARVHIEKAVIGFGPALVKARRFELRAIPLNSYVMPHGANPYVESDPAALPPGRVTWTQASRWRRAVLLVIAPRVVAFSIAALFLGPHRALTSTVNGVPELIAGVFAPLSTGRALVIAAATLPLVTLIGVVTAKIVAMNLFAVPTDVAYAMSTTNDKRFAKIRAVLLFVVLAASLSWVVAIIAALVKTS